VITVHKNLQGDQKLKTLVHENGHHIALKRGFSVDLLSEGPRPTLLPGQRPFLPAERSVPASLACGLPGCAWCTGLTRYCFRSDELSKDPERVRRLLTRNPFPLESPGVLGYSPLSRSLVSLRSPIDAARRFFKRADVLSMR
jgi:hypothetical protein